MKGSVARAAAYASRRPQPTYRGPANFPREGPPAPAGVLPERRSLASGSWSAAPEIGTYRAIRHQPGESQIRPGSPLPAPGNRRASAPTRWPGESAHAMERSDRPELPPASGRIWPGLGVPPAAADSNAPDSLPWRSTCSTNRARPPARAAPSGVIPVSARR